MKLSEQLFSLTYVQVLVIGIVAEHFETSELSIVFIINKNFIINHVAWLKELENINDLKKYNTLDHIKYFLKLHQIQLHDVAHCH